MSDSLTGPAAIRWARRAASVLQEKQEEINALNVFPIPDSDTGSNMAATMASACRALDDALGETNTPDEDASLARATTALAMGAVRGARGNSGVVLSQILRALADYANRGSVGSQQFAEALHCAVEFVEEAIATPVEGTILTVLRAAAEAGSAAAAAPDTDFAATLGAIVSAATHALAQTPSQLQVLADSGVVDAGGAGFVLLMEIAYEVLVQPKENDEGETCGENMAPSASKAPAAVSAAAALASRNTPASHPAHGSHAASTPHAAHASRSEHGAHTPQPEIEVMYFFETHPTDTQPAATIRQLRSLLQDNGNSVITGPVSDTAMTVHVHTLHAGAVIEKSFALGRVSDLRLEVLPLQNTPPELPERPILALLPQGAGTEVFEGAGACAIPVFPGAADDPHTTSAFRTALERLTANEVLVLTNGEDPTPITRSDYWNHSGKELFLLDTESLVGGLAALAVYDATAAWEDNMDEMDEVVTAQRWAEVSATTLTPTLCDMLHQGGELVTLIAGDDVAEQQLAAARGSVEHDFPDVEMHTYRIAGFGDRVQVGVE